MKRGKEWNKRMGEKYLYLYERDWRVVGQNKNNDTTERRTKIAREKGWGKRRKTVKWKESSWSGRLT